MILEADIAFKTTKKISEGINLMGYYHVYEPQCFKNTFNEIMVDFFKLPNSAVAKDANAIVNQYYHHTLKNPSHMSNEFKTQFSEHFGSFTAYRNEPYISGNTASSHCQNHQKCVQDLIKGLQPLSNNVNNYLENAYPKLYTKIKELDLGPNVSRSFGGFPTIAINFNVISQFHRDPKDHPNTLCIVCPLGSFTGGELVFPELKLIIHAKQGYAIAFRSNFLVHGNLPVILGNRHSAVFFIHSEFIKQNRSFNSLKKKIDLNINDDNDDNNNDNNNKHLVSKSNVLNSRRNLLSKY
jgi:2-oxoglutarate-Fe(II)-dependent dioxygenase family protein